MNIAEMTNKISEDIHVKLQEYLEPYNSEIMSSRICFTHDKYCGYFRGRVLGFQALAYNIELNNTEDNFTITFDPELFIILENEETKEVSSYNLYEINVVFWHSWQGKDLDKWKYINIF